MGLLDGMDERPALTLIDPVMGDNGALYAGFSDASCRRCARSAAAPMF